MSNAKFYLNEENMGNAEVWQAVKMITKLAELGWDVSYGDSTMTKATEYERHVFDKAWEKYLHAPAWAVLRRDKFGPDAIPAEYRTS